MRRRSEQGDRFCAVCHQLWWRTGGLLAIAVGVVTLLSAGPASAATLSDAKLVKVAAANPLGCVVNNVLSKPLAGLGDPAYYALAPGGNFESGAGGWLLTGRGRGGRGDETAHVGSPADRSSLGLPFGSSATSPLMCIDGSYPHFRVFARNTGSTRSTLKVEVLYMDAKGKIVGSGSGTIAGATAAGSSPPSQHRRDLQHRGRRRGGTRRLPLHPFGRARQRQIDDVYIDPYARH